jgi:Icc protein
MGHIHRPCSGVMHAIPYATLGAVSFQAPAPRSAWTWDRLEQAQEAPRLGVIVIENANVTIQYLQFCDVTHGMTPYSGA